MLLSNFPDHYFSLHMDIVSQGHFRNNSQTYSFFSPAFPPGTAGEHSAVILTVGRKLLHDYSRCGLLQRISEPSQFKEMLEIQKRPATDGRASEQRSTDGACERFRTLPFPPAFLARTAGEHSAVITHSG